MSRSIQVSILFMTVFVALMIPRPTHGAIGFVASACLMGFFSYLERNQMTETSKLRSELDQLKSRVDSLSLSKGFGR